MIKLLLSDMDGTLLPFGATTVSQRTHEAILAAQQAGIHFGPASGRDRAALLPAFDGDQRCVSTGTMATAVISGRVDEQVRESAERYIQAAGLTVADVIRTVWERIARTGEVPREEAVGEPADAAWNDFMAFRDEISGEASWLDALTEREVRDLVAARYE